MTSLAAALLLGLLGSFHCIGMCGPIALALPYAGKNLLAKISSVAIYNFGRVFTYGVLGILAGTVGKGLALAGLQQVLSVGLGVLILIFFILPKFHPQTNSATLTFFSFTTKVKAGLGNLFSRKKRHSLFLIGLLNGLLPCGLVYIALAGALALGDVFKSGLFMAFFGLGTLPVMMAVSIFRSLFPVKVRSNLRRAIPFFVSAMAILLILRGLNLGIPYISPATNDQKSMSCCPATNCKK